jgi:hypothetical protein
MDDLQFPIYGIRVRLSDAFDAVSACLSLASDLRQAAYGISRMGPLNLHQGLHRLAEKIAQARECYSRVGGELREAAYGCTDLDAVVEAANAYMPPPESAHDGAIAWASNIRWAANRVKGPNEQEDFLEPGILERVFVTTEEIRDWWVRAAQPHLAQSHMADVDRLRAYMLRETLVVHRTSGAMTQDPRRDWIPAHMVGHEPVRATATPTLLKLIDMLGDAIRETRAEHFPDLPNYDARDEAWRTIERLVAQAWASFGEQIGEDTIRIWRDCTRARTVWREFEETLRDARMAALRAQFAGVGTAAITLPEKSTLALPPVEVPQTGPLEDGAGEPTVVTHEDLAEAQAKWNAFISEHGTAPPPGLTIAPVGDDAVDAIHAWLRADARVHAAYDAAGPSDDMDDGHRERVRVAIAEAEPLLTAARELAERFVRACDSKGIEVDDTRSWVSLGCTNSAGAEAAADEIRKVVKAERARRPEDDAPPVNEQYAADAASLAEQRRASLMPPDEPLETTAKRLRNLINVWADTFALLKAPDDQARELDPAYAEQLLWWVQVRDLGEVFCEAAERAGTDVSAVRQMVEINHPTSIADADQAKQLIDSLLPVGPNHEGRAEAGDYELGPGRCVKRGDIEVNTLSKTDFTIVKEMRGRRHRPASDFMSPKTGLVWKRRYAANEGCRKIIRAALIRLNQKMAERKLGISFKLEGDDIIRDD